MEFRQLADEIVKADYQHKYVVEKYSGYLRGKKVMDAGCWTGPVESEIIERGIDAELVGIDENMEALNVAADNFSEFKFIQCKLTEPAEAFITKYESYFDTVMFLDVIEHLPRGSEIEVMKFLNKVMKPDGVIIMSTMASHFFNFVDPAWFVGHRHYKSGSINKILKGSGFEAIETSPIGNLCWDIDLLLSYIYKHILRRKYYTSDIMYKGIMRGFGTPLISTRIYLLAKKVGSGA